MVPASRPTKIRRVSANRSCCRRGSSRIAPKSSARSRRSARRRMRDLGFVHVFEPPADPSAPILLLLHGTGGNEEDLLPLVEVVAPSAGVLSPRGKVLERGMPRFFRRLAEGVFDIDDLRFRTAELADFIMRAAAAYKFDVAQ